MDDYKQYGTKFIKLLSRNEIKWPSHLRRVKQA